MRLKHSVYVVATAVSNGAMFYEQEARNSSRTRRTIAGVPRLTD